MDHIEWLKLKLAEEQDKMISTPPSKPFSTLRIPGVAHEYTMWPGNRAHTALLFQHPGGYFGLHAGPLHPTMAPGTLHKMLPAEINHSSQPRWSRTHDHQFYYLFKNQLKRYDVANNETVTIHTFDGWVSGKGEMDLSEDGDHIVLCIDNKVFVYRISTDTIINERGWTPFNNLYISCQNEAIIGRYNGGICTDRIKLTDALGHMATGRDQAGDAVIVWCTSNSKRQPWENSVEKVRIADGKRTTLLKLDPSLAFHVSMGLNLPWCLVSTYDPKDKDSAVTFANQLLKVMLDGYVPGYTSIGKHGALGHDYPNQPRAAVSPDGRFICWDADGNVFVNQV